jgi:nucleotide-binding universal stress UspA family protein
MSQIENEAREYVEQKVQEVKQKGLKDVTAVVKFGYGGEEIISLARETSDNFVAMCTHGRSGVMRLALGSVTERVVRDCGDPVLVVPGIAGTAGLKESRSESEVAGVL